MSAGLPVLIELVAQRSGLLAAVFLPEKLLTTMGDQELGKVSMAGRQGGLRFDSYQISERDLGIPGFWEQDFGAYKFIGIASSVIAFPVLEAEALPEERHLWQSQRERMLEACRESLLRLKPGQRILHCSVMSARSLCALSG